jgi:predicted aconitase
MRIVVEMAKVMGAEYLLDISSAHIDSCLYHGQASLDFARRLGEGGARVQVPTTLNVSSLDLLHPDLYRGDRDISRAAATLMDSYVAMGCVPTWTCAPYQLPNRPRFGEHIAWAESNAIVFANSVIGARTNRYGDFLDISCAVTGRAPAAGLHLDEGRIAGLEVHLRGLEPLLDEDWFYPVLGLQIGYLSGTRVPAIVGLDQAASEDRLKALGAAAASSGSVALFHAVGVTPEAPDLPSVNSGREIPVVVVGPAEIDAARRRLSTVGGGKVGAVSLGAPHYSSEELETLVAHLRDRRVVIPTYVNTSRGAVLAASSAVSNLEDCGITIVTDTCTYITPIIDPAVEVVMTDSAKWAYYAPGNLGVDVVFGSRHACLQAALTGIADVTT